MTGVVVIGDGVAEVAVLPSWGGGLARYDLIVDGRREPILRPAPEAVKGPFDLALNLLIPWSNRISGGGFLWGGTFHRLSPNVAGEPFPIHGDALLGAWRAIETRPDSVRLAFSNSGVGPFAYEAEVAYALDGGALTMRLSIRSRACEPLPFGFGFHPWFVRSRQTWLRAAADNVWFEDARHLPIGKAPTRETPDWDFSTPRRLPERWINNGFEGWRGGALLDWRDRDIAVAISVESRLSTYIVYSPSASADFFCFEPVSHPVDAHNLADERSTHGLMTLAPNERVETWCRLAPQLKRRGSNAPF